ncbi:FAD-binding oxidoreductase [Paecilomyces variotii No. 5]|uniref:FAD-binding oxidoreductase n=1 Tax=Byssochlamys spectabilis (strain No. 5 / NBRC 109023) TaxID=1356009 RepID=V5FQC4_BYSSN|nr:FAD-binding oxidoreductase [Paecilomyces variotii No. 5]
MMAYISKACAALSLLGYVISRARAEGILTGQTVITSSGSFNLTKTVEYACRELSETYAGQVLYPNSTNYLAEVTSYWDIRADLNPYCILLPNSADDIAGAVQKVVAAGAQFAVRGGGHMNYPGSNNIQGGVLIALEKLQDIKINDDTVELGPGLRWYQVYDALEPYGRITLGGRLKTIGVPGLTLIGGFHYFINKYGFVMDQVVSYDVVLGSGVQLTANATSHSDLFWALKGGANNLGIVTKFVFKTLDIPRVSSTIQEWNQSAIPAFIKAVTDLALHEDPEPIAAGGVLTITYNVTTKEASPSLLGLQEGVSNPPSQFANFTNIPGSVKIHNVTTAAQWASILDSPLQMFRVMFSHHTILPIPEVINEIYQTWLAGVENISDVEGLYPTFVLNVVPKGAAHVGKTNGIGNLWGLDDSRSWLIWQFSTGWSLQQDDLRVQSWSRELSTTLHEKYKALGITSEFVYMGDAGEWQDPFQGFPSENVKRFKEIRAQYDPDQVFSKLNWGGFKAGPSV